MESEEQSRDVVHVKTVLHRDDYERIRAVAQSEGRPVANWLRQVALVALVARQ